MIAFHLIARPDAKAAKAILSGIESIRSIKRGHIHNKQLGTRTPETVFRPLHGNSFDI